MPEPPAATAPGLPPRVLLALIGAQIGVHATMAGLRMAAPLQALREGYSAAAVGVLLALFAAAPVAIALAAGRLADRHGYHRPAHLAVTLTAAATVLAVASTGLVGWPHFALLCAAASCAGAGANIGMITLQRLVGQQARDGVERVRVFSWVGLAPSLANVVGPVLAGFAIDLGGFGAAYGLLAALPLVSGWCTRHVPRAPQPARAPRPPGRTSWDLLRAPGMRRLLLVNWVLSSCWDVHAFAVPVLGHQLGFSASTIGLILGGFTLSVSGVRLLLPLLAHRLREVTVVRASMLGTAAVFALYPLATSPWAMGACALLLGVTLGIVQPMIMSLLHQLTPEARHGEAIALRSMSINAASTMMPLLFGFVGAALGAALPFWVMAAATAAGSRGARDLRRAAASG
ncbi:MFS transporter [Calidifontimicrobium sp. SYSU G02091]|uniref:MFS transporter n=1 Tax=Calidifontimicrobium sp. SYSU G02091 TaxID=2926421 RepID=UPI001F53D552|nr:MFS transporter [Calidifontimicrobium sp. SYSU G02091]MCI1191957.1 MFS transporter [Calidifontimicrobium sp. SYSU G02091]